MAKLKLYTEGLLIEAIQARNTDSVNHYLSIFEGDINFYIGSELLSPLHFACIKGSVEIVELLLAKGARIDITNIKNETPLHYACYFGHEKIVEKFLDNGANLNLTSEKGFTPLRLACSNPHIGIIKILLEHGADVNLAIDYLGNSLLSYASHKGYHDVVALLLDYGAKVDFVNNDGFTPLFLASEKQHIRTMEILLNHGANINFIIDNHGNTILNFVSVRGCIEATRYLLANEANFNIANENGDTALHFACDGGHNAVAILLLEFGADFHRTNKFGVSPLDIAKSKDMEPALILMNDITEAKISRLAHSWCSEVYMPVFEEFEITQANKRERGKCIIS